MKRKETVRRFQGPEILVHWSCAALYLTLFFTGGLLLFARLSDRSWLFLHDLARVHRVAGILLVALLTQMLVLSVVAENYRLFWGTVRQALIWRWRDVVWLAKVPLNTISKRISLPPADRFNAGQKMHLLVVGTALLGFGVSGVAMILVPGALAPWIIHLICFAPAAAFLLLHLFLSLVNPETRKALPSIFSGKVTLEYARQHHGLWLGQTDSEHPTSYVSLTRILAVLLLLLGLVVAFTLRYGASGALRVVHATVALQGTNTISPGLLTRAHTGERSGVEHCAQCHSLLASPGNEKCLQCHEAIQARIAANSGFHGSLSGPCWPCHGEHRGRDASLIDINPDTFNHNQANFALQGRHQQTPCQACHGTEIPGNVESGMRYIGLDYESCVGCHADPHHDERAQDCLRCHTQTSWGRATLTFDHARDSRFALEGKHTELPCEECHPHNETGMAVRIQLFDIGRRCRDCHADPHQGQFKQSCDECHMAQGWEDQRRPSFHGPASSFPLRGQHRSLRCDECHKIPEDRMRLADAQFVGMGRECESCHRDPHEGQMSSTCHTCHVETGWRGKNLTFLHNRDASFKLDGLHATLACYECHNQQDKRYRPLPTQCGTCHEPQQLAMKGESQTLRDTPDPHEGRVSCEDCHDVDKPVQRLSRFANKCMNCHNAQYARLLYAWSEDFQKDMALAQQALDRTRDLADQQERELENRIREASQVGLHNVRLARRLWTEISDATQGAVPTR